MPRPKPTLAALGDLEIGQYADCFAQLTERSRNATRDGKPFIVCRFRDARRTVGVTIWSDGVLYEDCATNWEVGCCYKLRGVYFQHEKYGEQIELEQIRPVNDADRADGFDPLAMVERSGYDVDELFATLRGLVDAAIADRPLRRLVQLVLERHGDVLRQLPGSAKHYYPFAGGWLEHTLSVADKCSWLADRYLTQNPQANPPLNRDLVVAGAVLHDIGRVAEFTDPLTLEPTVQGKLIGPLILGRDLVRDAARDVPDLNPELLQLLEHLLLSYLAIPEWGSARLPCVPECLILHHADDLDAKMEMYVRCLTRDTSPGPFTDRDPVLGKSLLKERGV
jgi:3'-5' exoribonuclease